MRGPTPQAHRPTARRRQNILAIENRAAVKRQATAADTAVQIIPQPLQQRDAPVQIGRPAARNRFPIFPCRRPPIGQVREDALHVRQSYAEFLRDLDQRQTPQNLAIITALVAGRAQAADQAAPFVEMDSRDRYPGTVSDGTDGQFPRHDDFPFTSTMVEVVAVSPGNGNGDVMRRDSAWDELWRSGLLGRFLLICLGVWLHATDTLVTATILPKVVADIGGIDYMSWNLALYECGAILSGAAAAMLCGQIGIKRVMLTGSALYGLGCVIAACAGSMEILLLGRLAQGIGGGLLVTLSYIAIEQSFPQHLWTKLFGIVSAIWGAGSLLGPLIGGVLADAGLWRAVFVCFAIQAAMLYAVGAWRLPKAQSAAPSRHGFPVRQMVLLMLATAVIAEASQAPGLALPILLCISGLGLLYLAARADRLSRNPLLPRTLLAITGPMGAGLFMVFALSVSTTGFAIYGPLLMSILLGKSALFAGYLLAVEAVSWSLATMLITLLPRNWGSLLIRLGTLCIVSGVCGLSFAVPAGALGWIIVSAIAHGAGFGLCWPAIAERIIDLAAVKERTLAAGAASTVQRIGYAVGAAATGIIAHASGLSADLTLPVARQVGFWIFAGFAPLLLAALVCAWRFSARDRAATADYPMRFQ